MTVWYADTSALAKLLVREDETTALRGAVRATRPRVVTSEVAVTELLRVALRLGVSERRAWGLLQAVDLVAVGASVLAEAGRATPTSLRTLDAVHLATAETVRSACEVFVVYDRRLAEAADARGWEVMAPGR
jgi:uncharacterized protein